MKKYLGLFVGLAMLVPAAAGAANFQGGDNINIGTLVRDNAYIGGGTVNITGTIDGDLYVAGGTVNITGTITEDLIVMGGTVIVNGRIGDDVRIGGGNITIGANIAGELLVGGGNVSVLSGALINGKTYLAGGSINMDGTTAKDLTISAENITIGGNAKIWGNFDYYSSKQAAVESGARIDGQTNFHEQKYQQSRGRDTAPWLAFISFWWFMGILSMAILSLILFFVWRKESENMINNAFNSPGKELLRGFAVLFLGPIAAIILFVSVLGLPIGFLLIFSYIALAILAVGVSGLLAAALLAKAFKKNPAGLTWWLIALGVLALAIIKLIPFVGWIIGFLVYLAALGTLSKKLYSLVKPQK